MKITFPNMGEARYSFYREKNGKEVSVKSTVAKKAVEKEYLTPPILIELLVLKGVFTPVPDIP